MLIDLLCNKCRLHRHRHNVVSYRGDIPADVVFIGEAPGKSEDVIGKPFVGPSGKLLDAIIADAINASKLKAKICITNVVRCRPCDSWGSPNRTPRKDEIKACWSHLQDLMLQANPKLIVCVGDVAGKACVKVWPWLHTIYHPAYLLRRGGKTAPEFKINVVNLTSWFMELRLKIYQERKPAKMLKGED